MGAMPMGAPGRELLPGQSLSRIKVGGVYTPGWPELALPTTSAARVRMVATLTSSTGDFTNLDMAGEGE